MSEHDKAPAAEPPADQPDQSDQPTSEQPAAAEATPGPTPVAPRDTADAGATPAKPRFFDRMVGMRAVAAVALASVLLGGAGGAALGALSDGGDDDRNGRNGRFGGPMTNFRGPSGMDGNQMPPPGRQGQLPPALPPQGSDSSSGDTSSDDS